MKLIPKQLLAYCPAMMLAALASSMMTVAAASTDRVGDFALLDEDGYFHHMAWYDNHAAIAFLVQVNGAQQTEAMLQPFSELKSRYAEQGIQFFMINPLGQDRDRVRQEAAQYGTEIPVLIDEVQAVSEALGIQRAGEALLFDPVSFEVVYRGPAGEPLAAAIEDVLADRPVRMPDVAVEQGAPVRYYARGHTELSYATDVAPILADNCARCHREGGIAPFALDSHAMVQGWSPMIREVLMTKRMPPGQIDPHVGEFENSYTLPVEDQRKILDWIAAGSPRGDDPVDPLAELTWPESDWAFGEPDLVVEVPPQEIPATGVLDYIHTAVPLRGMEQDRWVRASQYLPGDRTVLHHTLNSIVGPDEDLNRSGFLGGGNPNEASIQAYIPGAQPHMEEPNTGGLLKKGSTLALQLHYTTTGKATVDRSRIGIWFYPEGEVPEERMSGACACIFTPDWTEIPPYDPNFEQTKAITLERDAYLYSFLPHMHFRGKYMRFEAHYPDGTTEELINIANYSYNWQMEYRLKEPKFVPAGTQVVAIGAFDNSAQNPNNPDPSRSVPWGQQSWDEMFFGAVNWKWADQSIYVSSTD